MNALKNRVQLIGNIGQAPEITDFNGKKRAIINIATRDGYRNAQGEFVENTMWHRVVAWGKNAEFAEKYLEKGKEIAIDGRLVHRDYEDKEGVKRYVTEVVVNEFAFVGKK